MNKIEDLEKIPDMINELAKKHTSKKQFQLNEDSKKAIRIYMNEMEHDLKALKKALSNQDFPMIRHSSYGVQMNANWIIEIIKKYEV